MAAVALVLGACGTTGGADTTEGGAATSKAGATSARGAELFANNCARCHGEDLGGTNQGPPFLHEYYVPSHHADAAFMLAVQRGVAPHHWDFGPMPPIDGLSDDDVAAIVAHVRQQQRDAGLVEAS